MGKNKLAKFAEMEDFPHVFQYPYAALKEKGFELKGRWKERFFQNNNPIIIELGCGKGEYTVGLGKLFPDKNFIGVDVKGARMWSGARESLEAGMQNIAFLRTSIELISSFFAPGEVAEIWLTFPDPQMKKVNKRLTSTRFMKLYKEILTEDGVVHLKTDSNFMFTYTQAMVDVNRFPVQVSTSDLYHSEMDDPILSIQTYYEQQWLERGIPIKYISFKNEDREALIEPDIEIEYDSYRSFNRSKRSGKESNK